MRERCEERIGVSMERSESSTLWAGGVAVADALLLLYGLLRPESLGFSIPFLIAPSIAVLAGVVAGDRTKKRLVLWVASGVVVGLIIVLLLNDLAMG
jgi:hypothetical protein